MKITSIDEGALKKYGAARRLQELKGEIAMKNIKWKAVLALSLVVAVFTGVTGVSFAAGPDANVKGLWLRCPGFPEDAQVLEFEDNEEYGVTTYIRSLDDAMLTFEIRRQKIEESELREPDDARGIIEMRVNNDDGDEDDIDVETYPNGITEHFSYPCATAEYTTGQNEDTRKNASLFIFTDVYCFEVAISAAADWFEDYEDRATEWLTALEFVEDGNAVDAEKGESSAMSGEDFLELCKDGTPGDIERAIKAGANLEARNEYGETPLLVAIEHNENSGVVAVLIEGGADMNAKDENGETALITATENREDTDVLMMLLKAGADVNETDEDGDIALHYAAYWNSNPEVVKMLLANGAILNCKGEYERTPLMHAVAGSEAGNIIALLDAGADANIKDEDGKKAIDHVSSEMPNWVDKDAWEPALERLRNASK